MILHSLIVQYEITDVSPSHHLIFIENETANHFYYVHVFDGKVVVIKSGDEDGMTAEFEKKERQLKTEGWANNDSRTIEDRLKFDEDGLGEVGDLLNAQMHLSKAISDTRHIKTLLSSIRGSHAELMKKRMTPQQLNYTSWGEWA